MRRGEDIDVGHDSAAVDFDICYLGGGGVVCVGVSAWSARHLHASFEDKFLFIYLFYCGLIRVMNSMACEHYFNNCTLQQ